MALSMGDLLNDDLFEAVSTANMPKCLDVINRYQNNPESCSCLNIDEALILSIPTQHIDIIKLLLDNCRANVKYTDGFGRRAIHVAVETKNVDVLKLILRAGSPVNVPNNEGKSPLHLACENGSEEIAELLLDGCANINRAQTYQMNEFPMHIAAKKGYTRILEALRRRGGNLDARTKKGQTPLHYAVLSKQYTTVPYLCSVGADINAVDSSGETALSIALKNGRWQMAQNLLEQGARADVLTETKRSVLHYIPSLMTKTGSDKHKNIYEQLLTSAADVINTVSENGTPLHTAVYFKFG